MDILDIDEALKDDSFICLEDKTHDDVSNILQQWKSNNCVLPPQYQQEQAYKLNSRTFTRPRRKSAQNLEAHFTQNGLQTLLPTHPEQLQRKFTIATPQPMLNLEIGGLVTTMHKSFLQDTSPPSSICSSMEMSMERMNSSLITSADFTNINFLQSTQSLDFNEPMLNGGDMFNLANKATSDGYTLSDMIRDRKALESLTMSGDATLIKDSHIGQIDDISLALSKTASGYSTMDNSTESMQDDQQQRNGITPTSAIDTTTIVDNSVLSKGKGNIMHRTMLLSDEVISDTTFDLVESSLCESNDNGIDIPAAAGSLSAKFANETFKKIWPMDETVCLPTKANATFEFEQLTPDARLASDTRCETPENLPGPVGAPKLYESTPHAAGLNARAHNHTPTTSKLTADEFNLSPIVGATDRLNATRVLSATFGAEFALKQGNSKTFSGTLPRLESIEKMLDDIENPNESYDKIGARTQVLQQSAADIQMQNVLELAHAEEELLASNNDQEFEHMLEEFSKVEVNAEHVKMKKSLETIKRRFNRDTITLSKAPSTLQNAVENEQHIGDAYERSVEVNNVELSEQKHNGSYTKTESNSCLELRRSLLADCSAPSELLSPSPSASASSPASSITASIGGGNVNATTGERLLSRRSRLYDNINLSTISAGSTHSPSRTLGASFTVNKRRDGLEECCAVSVDTAPEAAEKHETDYKDDEQKDNNLRKTDDANEESDNACSDMNHYSSVGTYKLSERRERDRDRFKTIKIVKGRNANDGLVSVNVPCIDDDISVGGGGNSETAAHAAVFNNNKSEIETEKFAMPTSGNQSSITTAARMAGVSRINPNFLTYKKSKDKPTLVGNLPEIASYPLLSATVAHDAQENPPEPPIRLRSRSRPRYISGLQKMTVVKATSAGELDRATGPGLRPPNRGASHAALNNCQDTNNSQAVAPPTKFTRNTQPIKRTTEEVKSPMGTKSKSFHNLSCNFGFNGSSSCLAVPRNSNFGLKKLTAYENNGAGAANAVKDCAANGTSNTPLQQADDAVFKVPKLVSGLRAPGVKRAGLVRPSSGYYSINSLAAKGMPPLPQPPQANDADSDGGRHSPTDSMSSASSRGSIHSGSGSGGIVIGKPIAMTTKQATAANTSALNLTKITTGATGIPKPSGLRPPTTAIKRSGFPKPGSGLARPR